MLHPTVGIFNALISIFGFLLNGYIFLVLVLSKKDSPKNLLLIHLSATETLISLMFLVFSFPPTIIQNGNWIDSEENSFPCILNGFLFTILHPLALWTICGLNCDRFYAIAEPLHYCVIVTKRKVIVGVITSWILLPFLTFPLLFNVTKIEFNPDMCLCLPNFLSQDSLWHAILFTVLSLILPGIILVMWNVKVLMIARYHRHRIAAAIYEVTLSAQVTITHQRNPFMKFPPLVPNPIAPKVRLRSPITKIFQLVGSYIILYTPYFITVIWDSTNMIIFGDKANIPAIYKTNKYFVMMSVTLLTCSTVVNGILYGLKSKTIRKSFQNYRRKKRTKNEIQQEIQARTPSTCGSRQASMTNLGLLARPLLQRRLSETLVDIDNRPKIKRIASELTWRPISITFAGLEAGRTNGVVPKTQIVHTTSCNTLQVPATDNELISDAEQDLWNSVRNSFRSAKLTTSGINPRHLTFKAPITNDLVNLNNVSTPKSPTLGTSATNFLLHTIFRKEQHNHLEAKAHKDSASPLKSPRILITRAISDESGSRTPSVPGTPGSAKRFKRQYCSSAALDEWGLEKLNNLQSIQSIDACDNEMRPFIDSSSSTTCSSADHRKYSSLEETSCFSNKDFEFDSETEEQTLLSWPISRKKLRIYNFNNNNVTNQCETTVATKLLNPSTLFNDRCEEPPEIM
ncbi:hypothetical protein ACFFRR_002196 [Megaselia abdita]